MRMHVAVRYETEGNKFGPDMQGADVQLSLSCGPPIGGAAEVMVGWNSAAGDERGEGRYYGPA